MYDEPEISVDLSGPQFHVSVWGLQGFINLPKISVFLTINYSIDLYCKYYVHTYYNFEYGRVEN